MRRIIFLDRDGVINQFPGYGKYVTSWQEFRFIERSLTALERLRSAGYEIFVVSNQAGVGRGIYSKEALEEITRNMLDALQERGITLKRVFYCTHRPDEGCACRKPGTLFFEQVLKDYPEVPKDEIFMVGDSEKDIIAGKRIGIRTALVLSGQIRVYDPKEWPEGHHPDLVCADLLDFVEYRLGGG